MTTKKVLIVTYYWPPAGGPGVQRWLNFVKHLPTYGIEPVVFIPDTPSYPIVDESLLSELPEAIKVYKSSFFEPYKLASFFAKKKSKTISSGIINAKNQSFVEKLLLWVRGNLFIPDARKFWVKPAVKQLREILKEEGITTLITSGPPHSLHLIGLELKKNDKNIRWISDFRDPWTSIGYHKKLKLSSFAAKKHKELEQQVLNTADEVIVTSFTTKAEFQAITNKPITVITNGFSERSGEIAPIVDTKFSMVHIGSLLTGRDPEMLWQSLSELITEQKGFAEDLSLEFVGVVSEDVLASIYEFELEPYVALHGYFPHSAVLKKQGSSQVLLLLEIDSIVTKGIIPGKLFEYMASRRPILAIGPQGWDVAKIIEETQSGKCFTYAAKEEVKLEILRLYELYKNGSFTVPSKAIDRYSRATLTKAIATLIKAN